MKTTSLPSSEPISDGWLTFQFLRRLGSFELDVAWTTQARRLAILGPSGSGKTLTLRMLAGLDTAGVWTNCHFPDWPIRQIKALGNLFIAEQIL